MKFSHIAWNLGGLAVPLMVAAMTVPTLISKLGHERFGLLALAWGLIGYAGALDLGLGRALTQVVSRMRGENKLINIPDALATASRITMLTGFSGGVLIAIFGLMGGVNLIKVDEIPVSEVILSILLLAIALPAQAMSSTYKGVNEAYMNFKGVSLLRAGLGVINFLGPYAVSFFTLALPWLISTLVLSRLMSLFIYKLLAKSCLQRNLSEEKNGKYSNDIAKKLFSFGGWVTISSVIAPAIVQADRFFIASAISVTAVSYYVLPYELVLQSMIIVGAISSVIYPGLSKLIHESPHAWRDYFRKWLIRVVFMMFLICSLLILVLPYILLIWIGDDLNAESIYVAQILAVGVFFNAIASMYFALIHANERMDLTAKIHILELPFYIFMLIYLVEMYGIVGAACAWVIRAGFDALAMFFVSRNFHDKNN